MSEVFKYINRISEALDRAKIMERDAAKAKAIVDSCVVELQKVSKALVVPVAVSLQDSGTGLNQIDLTN